MSPTRPAVRDETRRTRLPGIPLLLLIAILLAALPARALVGWEQVRTLTVANGGAALADYQVRVELDAGNFDFTRARPDGADLRVTEADLVTLLPHWIEVWDPLAERATVWVRVAGLAAGAGRELVLHAGNPQAATASDGAATFLFYSSFEELAAGLGLNAPVPLVTPTYEGSGQVVHPDVVHVPGGWNGYEYWMGMTPYPNGYDQHENPSILASNDNLAWVEPTGVTNPLAPTPPGHNDDVDMLLVDGRMILYYVETNNDGQSYIQRLSSTDGIDWGTPETVLTIPNYVMSPAVVHDGAGYTMWYLQSPAGCTSSYQDILRRESADGIAWGPAEAVELVQPGRVPWHFDVQPSDDGLTMLFISYPDGSSCGNTRLYYAESDDGLDWTVAPEPLLQPVSGSWDSANIYRASYTIDGTWLRIWYSARSVGGQWRVGYTEGDLADFPGDPVGTWSELHGNVVATTEQARSGSHGLREIGGSTYPQVFGALDRSDVCVNVWYHDDLAADTDFMALLRLWDADTSVWAAHCIGAGVWTGSSTDRYSFHTEGFAYTPTADPRTAGWRHLAIAARDSSCDLRVDGVTIATLDVLDPLQIDRFSVEGYRGGTGYFDDAYVRCYREPEPTAAVGPEIVSATAPPPVGPAPRLEQNTPNPLNPSTEIAFDLPRGGPIRLEIYDPRGRLVRALVVGDRPAGRQTVRWDGRNEGGAAVASGTYLYRLTTPDGVACRKLMLVR